MGDMPQNSFAAFGATSVTCLEAQDHSEALHHIIVLGLLRSLE